MEHRALYKNKLYLLQINNIATFPAWQKMHNTLIKRNLRPYSTPRNNYYACFLTTVPAFLKQSGLFVANISQLAISLPVMYTVIQLIAPARYVV